MHSRRRFYQAFEVGGKKPGLAADGIAMFKWLYEREAEYKAQGLTPQERKAIRDLEIAPSLAEMKSGQRSNLPKRLKQAR